ncbi:MAG: hypothetical protein KGY44_09725 [Halanaerobiales bacterium]|nr:hypothetical protein [Halanaerobiales bacterium]
MYKKMPTECCWCGNDTTDSEVFTIPVKFKKDTEHPEVKLNGYITNLEVGGKKVWAIVTGLNSEAKQAGNDLIFMFCSKDCAYEFKDTLEEDMKFYNELF